MSSFPVHRFDILPSTNVTAKEYADNGAPSPTVIIANHQSKGRGRMEREFASPLGGLYMSIILRPDFDDATMPLITLAAGLACATVIEESYGLTISLKWPNDLYIGTRKLAGILTETGSYSYALRKIPYVVVGIGINVNSRLQDFNPSLDGIVTSLVAESGKEYPPSVLIEPIVKSLEHYCRSLKSEKNRVLDLWRQKDFLYGKKIGWHKPDSTFVQGIGQGMDSTGCYLIRDLQDHILPVLGGRLRVLE